MQRADKIPRLPAVAAVVRRQQRVPEVTILKAKSSRRLLRA
jgi:hypothetical protein